MLSSMQMFIACHFDITPCLQCHLVSMRAVHHQLILGVHHHLQLLHPDLSLSHHYLYSPSICHLWCLPKLHLSTQYYHPLLSLITLLLQQRYH